MALPKQVAAQAAEVEAFEKQVAEARRPQEPKPEPDAPPETQQEQAKESSPQPVAAPSVKADDSAVWEQRYRSLQGQYNAQVPVLQQQIRELTATVSTLTDELKREREAKQPAKQEPAELVTKSDVETFGEDLVDLARRIARDEFGRRESKYQERIEELKQELAQAKGQVGEVAQTQARSAQQSFFDALSAKLPNWEQVQATAECQDFLRSTIPGTRMTWDAALKQAGAERDLNAVLEVFGAFFAKHPTLDPNKAKQTQPAPSKDLARQVAPGKSAASAAQPQKRVYTSAEYESEGDRVVKLMRTGQREEAMRLEQELDAALAEGRVMP